MAAGPGRYNTIATRARKDAGAEGVILVVLGGARGQGFEAQLPPHLQTKIPELLRWVADEIEKGERS